MWVAAVCRGGGGVAELALRRGVDGLPGWEAADGVPHCEGRRLASRGRAREGTTGRLGGKMKMEGGDGTGIGGALLPKCQQASGERDRGEGLWWRQAGRQACWREPTNSEIRVKAGLGSWISLLIASTEEEPNQQICH